MSEHRVALTILVALAFAGAQQARTQTTIYQATKDTSFSKGAPYTYYGTSQYLPRSEKGGDPYWDVSLGFLLLDFDRAAILSGIEAQLGHPGTLPTLPELSRVTLNLNVMSRGEQTTAIGVPAIILSATDTNWTEAGVGYYGVDAALGGTNQWKDQNGADVSSLREVMRLNDLRLPGGMVRNANGHEWAPVDTYTTWKLDPAVILSFLSGAQGVAGMTIVTDGPPYDNNAGAYARESDNPPYLELGPLSPLPPTPPPPTGPIFPEDHILNTPIDTQPVHTNSAAWIATIGVNGRLHPDFGTDWSIPYTVVTSNQSPVNVTFDVPDESEPGPYPIPTNAPIEGGPDGTGDRHVLALDKDRGKLYELFSAYPTNNSWQAYSGAVFDILGYALRPDGWTSADAAGLPILPLLVRYDEIAAGEIKHALRFTAPQTKREYLWPARHYASTLTSDAYPPMGARLRLKADYNISGFDPTNQVILRALKKYGMILADNGSAWFITGAPDARFDNDGLHALTTVPGSAFEVVDCSDLMIDKNSGRVRCTSHPATATPTVVNGFLVAISVTDGGCGYTDAPDVRISGGGGSGASATATVSNGMVTLITVTDAGFGYTGTPLVEVVLPCVPHPATATATVVNGFLVAISVTDRGCGYTDAPDVGISGGSGIGAVATATVSYGEVTQITVTDAGFGYTNTPLVHVASPSALSLEIVASSGKVVMSWPTAAAGFRLESTGSLTQPDWQTVLDTPVVVGNRNTVTSDLSGEAKFYRLRQP